MPVRTLITEEQIERGVDELAQRISDDYAGRPLTLLGVLTGSIILVADLMRRLSLPHKLGLLQASTRITPIPAAQYPTPARRPSYSVLDKSATWRDLELAGVHWRQQLREMLKDYQEHPDD